MNKGKTIVSKFGISEFTMKPMCFYNLNASSVYSNLEYAATTGKVSSRNFRHDTNSVEFDGFENTVIANFATTATERVNNIELSQNLRQLNKQMLQ